MAIRVQTRRHGRPKQETLVAMEALASRERWFFVSNAPRRTPLEELVKAASRRHLIEEAFENGKGEVGLGEIAARCRCQLRRNEEARISHWLARGLEPPSRRHGRDLLK